MKNKKPQALLIAVVLTLMGLPSFACAFDGKNEQETLRGINALHVIVHEVDPETDKRISKPGLEWQGSKCCPKRNA
jgi:hypothetical protein